MNENIQFSELQLFTKNQYATIDDFKDIPQEEIYTKNDTHYKIKTKIIDNSFVWFYIQYGKSKPYSDELFDTKTNEILQNKREQYQAELKEQLFFLYSNRQRILYLSNIKYAGLLTQFLNEKTNLEFYYQRIYSSPEEFIEKIKNLNEISFTALPQDMINKGLFDNFQDEMGFDGVELFNIKLKYNNKKLIEEIKKKLLNFLRNTRNGQLNVRKMICRGMDDENKETIFNLDNIVRKLPVHAYADENGFFKEDEIRISLIKELENDI
ncbi:MAG: hypothetical protein IJV35_07355 [Neisseriaceae bacterium]|nr:hypothetical protein [Neisseriaceae bacterium]